MNVCTILEQVRFYDILELATKCLAFIRKNAKDVLASDDYLQLSNASVLEVLNLELPVDEIKIFTAANRWVENKCRLANEPISGQTKRQHRGEIVYAIRFPLLTSKELAHHVSPSDVLTHKEELDIFRH